MANGCPNCAALIDASDINIGEGVALCPSCGTLTRLSELVAEVGPIDPELPPPKGCGVKTDGLDTVISATCANKAGAVGFLLFAAFWNSIVSVFVLAAIGSLYTNLVGPLPSWAPTPPGTGGSSNSPMSLGMSIFMTVFITPFVLVGLFLVWSFLLALGGVVRVTLHGGSATIFSGVGRMGRTRRVELAAVERVRIHQKLKPSSESEGAYEISLEGAGTPIRFGSMLTKERREWMASAIKGQLLELHPR